MSRYNTIINNDVVNGIGVCVSFFVQGCPHHCPGCFNQETWDFEKGIVYDEHVRWEIIKAIGANGIQRNFSVLGGEPLAIQNLSMTAEVVNAVRHAYPNIKIYLWTGYLFDELIDSSNPLILQILNNIDVLIDGPFMENQKDLSLTLRGSRNQRIFVKRSNIWEENYGKLEG